MNRKRLLAAALSGIMILGSCNVAYAKKVTKTPEEELAERAFISAPQEKIIRTGEDGKLRVIITSDLEIDDMNSFIHQCLFFNEIDLAGIVVSGSFCHFTGDGGEHKQGDITDHLFSREEGAENFTEFRPQPLDWLPNLWNNEYAEAYEYLSQNAEGYPSPEKLTEITKIGNVQFEGDVREDTEGSDLIKNAILDDDERNLFILSWGGFNSVARALISIYEEYSETDEWDAIYKKVCDKVLISGHSQDHTYTDYIVDKYPDLVDTFGNCGYAGYSASKNAQEDALYTFQADWLKENIKFDHGSLMGVYKLVNDGQHLEGEEDEYQFGETNTIFGNEYNDYDFIAEGDTISIMGLYNTLGFRTFENGIFGGYGGRYFYTTAAGEDPGYLASFPGGEIATNYIIPGADKIGKYNPYLLDFQLEWAARADWCVNSYENCNHAPIVSLENKDYTVAAGETVQLTAEITDPDGNDVSANWSTEPTACVYHGEDKDICTWTSEEFETSFTVPEDAQTNDCFILTLRAQDQADAVMTRYAQVMITVA